MAREMWVPARRGHAGIALGSVVRLIRRGLGASLHVRSPGGDFRGAGDERVGQGVRTRTLTRLHVSRLVALNRQDPKLKRQCDRMRNVRGVEFFRDVAHVHAYRADADPQ